MGDIKQNCSDRIMGFIMCTGYQELIEKPATRLLIKSEIGHSIPAIQNGSSYI